MTSASIASTLRTRAVRKIANGANVTTLRLRLHDEDVLRYVFNDWETDCGIRSNQEAQVSALIDRSFRTTIAVAGAEIQRAAESGRVGPRGKVPLALRGWPSVTAKPGKSSGAGATVVVDSDRMIQPERWTMTRRRDTVRDPTLVAYRTLVRMGEVGHGLMVTVLFKLYGPRDPAADYLLFGDFAPIAHMTKCACELADRATRALRREVAGSHADTDRSTVEPRQALACHIRRIDRSERAATVDTVGRQAEAMLARATTSFYAARNEVIA